MNPMNDRAYVELGWLYKNKGKYSEAKEVFNKAIAMFKKEIKVTKEKDKVYGCLGRCYQELGNYKLADAYFEKANNIRFGYYNPKMRHNYHKLKEILANRNIKLVCVQYPMRSVESLRRMFKDKEGIIFVDNEMIFKEAVEKSNYNEYFGDIFAGDFGHCTDKGNKLIATNIADTILRECFDKKFQIID